MPSGGAISRQGSLCSLTLSDVEGQLHGVNLDDLLRTAGSARKTADEVWRDIQGGTQMTLEDYLSRPGAAAARGGRRAGAGRAVPRPRPRPRRGHHVRTEACRRGRPRGEDGGAAEEADDQEPGVGGEVAREEAGVHERAREQDLPAGRGEPAAQELQGI